VFFDLVPAVIFSDLECRARTCFNINRETAGAASSSPAAPAYISLLSEDALPEPAPLSCDIAEIAARSSARSPLVAPPPPPEVDLEALVDAMSSLDIVREVGDLPPEARPPREGEGAGTAAGEAAERGAAAFARDVDALLRRMGVDPATTPASEATKDTDCSGRVGGVGSVAGGGGGAAGNSGGGTDSVSLSEVDVLRWAHTQLHGRREADDDAAGGVTVGSKRSAAALDG
jgi:hypothetical protein